MITCGFAIKHYDPDPYFFRPWPAADDYRQSSKGERLFIWHKIKQLELDQIRRFCDLLNPMDYYLISIGPLAQDTQISGWWEENNFDLRLARSLEYFNNPRFSVRVQEHSKLYSCN